MIYSFLVADMPDTESEKKPDQAVYSVKDVVERRHSGENKENQSSSKISKPNEEVKESNKNKENDQSKKSKPNVVTEVLKEKYTKKQKKDQKSEEVSRSSTRTRPYYVRTSDKQSKSPFKKKKFTEKERWEADNTFRPVRLQKTVVKKGNKFHRAFVRIIQLPSCLIHDDETLKKMAPRLIDNDLTFEFLEYPKFWYDDEGKPQCNFLERNTGANPKFTVKFSQNLQELGIFSKLKKKI